MDKKDKLGLAIVSVFTTIFSIASSILSFMKYISFHDTVFDLGVSSDLIKNATSSPVQYQKLIYFLMFPVYHFFPSQIGLMVFQDAFICAGSILIFDTVLDMK